MVNKVCPQAITTDCSLPQIPPEVIFGLKINMHFGYHFLLGPPTILRPPEDQFEINDGSNATFVCGAFAFPLHELDWTLTDATGTTTSVISTSDNQDTDKYSVDRSRETIEMFGVLTVRDVQYEDRGRYTCIARNILGSDAASATLTVHGE